MPKKLISQEYLWSKRNDLDPNVRWVTAENIIDQDLLYSMRFDESVDIVCTVAQRIESQDRLRDMWLGAHPRVREIIASRTTDMKFLWTMRNDTNERVRAFVALRMECLDSKIAEFRTDPSSFVRRMAARNTKTVSGLQHFLDDPDRQVRETAIQGITKLLGCSQCSVIQEGTILVDGTSCIPDELLILGIRENTIDSKNWTTSMIMNTNSKTSNGDLVTLNVRRTITITMEVVDDSAIS